MLSLIVKPVEGLSDDRNEQRQIFLERRYPASTIHAAPGATRVGEPQQIEVGGQPALDMRFRFKNGVAYRRLYAVRERHFWSSSL